MPLICNRNMATSRPRVLISQNKYQYIVSFNAALAHDANISEIKRAIAHLGVDAAKLSFIFTDDDLYAGARTFSLHSDGQKTLRRALNIAKTALPFTPTLGYYDPIIGKDDNIEGGDGTHIVIAIKIGSGNQVKTIRRSRTNS